MIIIYSIYGQANWSNSMLKWCTTTNIWDSPSAKQPFYFYIQQQTEKFNYRRDDNIEIHERKSLF